MKAPIDESTRRRVIEEVARHGNKSRAARECGVHRDTVIKICQASTNCQESAEKVPMPARLPEPAAEAGGAVLPEPVPLSWEPYPVDTPGHWLIIGDIHLPYHDKRTIETAVTDAKRVGVSGIILNGDTLDFHQISRHYKEPSRERTRDEIYKGRDLLAWLRSQFPKARIIFKEGNHDERLRRYLAERAPEIFDIEDFHLPNVMRAQEAGIEWVGDKRIIKLGKLNVVHGHEFRGGGGVTPARWLWLRAAATALCHHFHRASEHTETALDGRQYAVWSVGCACYLYPEYDRTNKWVHGWATCEVAHNGNFSVRNRRILRDGSVC